MSSNKFNEMSQEMREKALRKARETREKKIEEGAFLKQEWLDANLWSNLRSKAGLRSPPSYISCSETKYIRRTLNAIGKDTDWFYENFSKPLDKFGKDNPLVPAYVLQGLMLEAAYSDIANGYKLEDEDD